MRAHELTEYESGTDNSAQIFAKLKSLGYEKIGSGQDATVWAKDEASVIKILMPTDKPHQAENGFITFYNFCKANSSPNLPRFIDIGGAHHTVFEINGTPYRQIAMERLNEIGDGTAEQAIVWLLSDLANKRATWDYAKAALFEPDTWSDDFPEDIIDQLQDAERQPGFDAEYGALLATMQKLFAVGKANGLGWDLHTENVMQRRDGTLVIVDPFYD